MFKNLLKSLLIFFISILIGSLLITLINYFSILPSNIISILNLILPVTTIFISSYKLGKQSEKKGYIEGLKFGIIIILLFIFLILILDKLTIKSLLYYLILLLTSTLSSMIGINRKKTNV